MLKYEFPNYDEVAFALSSTTSAFQPPDAHGLMCGFICATAGKSSDWEGLITGDATEPESFAGLEVLRQLYEFSYHQMSEFSFEFSLLLPSDQEDINVRTEALGLWCQGFLTGLGDARATLEQLTSEEVTDAFNDLVEIAQVNFGEITASDEEETAYYELEEHVRLIVLLMFNELRAAPQILADDDTYLH
jgi:uncharacterized protein YgfB (UPF0149 family)